MTERTVDKRPTARARPTSIPANKDHVIKEFEACLPKRIRGRKPEVQEIKSKLLGDLVRVLGREIKEYLENEEMPVGYEKRRDLVLAVLGYMLEKNFHDADACARDYSFGELRKIVKNLERTLRKLEYIHKLLKTDGGRRLFRGRAFKPESIFDSLGLTAVSESQPE